MNKPFEYFYNSLPGTLTTSSYVTTSSVSNMALCLAKYLSRHCFFLRPKMEQLTVGYTECDMWVNSVVYDISRLIYS